jgi:hypothetical protein
MRLYLECAPAGPGSFNAGNIDFPIAASVFPRQIFKAPRSSAEQLWSDIVYWNEVDHGGHFAAMEQPAIFVDELFNRRKWSTFRPALTRVLRHTLCDAVGMASRVVRERLDVESERALSILMREGRNESDAIRTSVIKRSRPFEMMARASHWKMLSPGAVKDFTAVGDVVNTAARLQAHARPGEIVMSTAVYKRVKDRHPVPVRRRCPCRARARAFSHTGSMRARKQTRPTAAFDM